MHTSVYTPPLAMNANTKSLGTQKASCIAFLEQMGLNWAMKPGFIFIHQPSFLASNIHMLNLFYFFDQAQFYYIHRGYWSFCVPRSFKRRCYITAEHNRGYGRLNQPFIAQTGFPHSAVGSPHHLHLHLKHSKTGAHNPVCGGGGGLQWVAAAVCEKSAPVADKR